MRFGVLWREDVRKESRDDIRARIATSASIVVLYVLCGHDGMAYEFINNPSYSSYSFGCLNVPE
jgi:hypothetical protein